MPQIIVTAGGATDREGLVTLRERVNVADFESDRFAANLLERLGWAVSDAVEAEQHRPVAEVEREDESDAEPLEINGAGSAKHYVPQPV